MSTKWIVVETKVNASPAHVWHLWTAAEHIVKWNAASDDWHTPTASNDLQVGGTFVYHMAARDGSVGFDFTGTYERVEELESIAYVMEDGRKVEIEFATEADGVCVTERFEPETVHAEDLQQAGWQAILNRFKAYAEAY